MVAAVEELANSLETGKVKFLDFLLAVYEYRKPGLSLTDQLQWHSDPEVEQALVKLAKGATQSHFEQYQTILTDALQLTGYAVATGAFDAKFLRKISRHEK